MRIRFVAVTFLALSLLVSSSAMAQQKHIVDSVAMGRAVAAGQATDQDNRAVVRDLLHQSKAQEVATRLGLDITKADAAVATLSGAELERLATQARAAKTELAGGSSVVIVSTTTILLVLIIIILLVR